MFNIGDKVKWNGNVIAEIDMPDELTTEMAGIIQEVMPENEFCYEVQFPGILNSFVEGELDLV